MNALCGQCSDRWIPPAGRFPTQRTLATARGFRARLQDRDAGILPRHMTVFYLAAGSERRRAELRVGFTVGKVLGGAVVRNRMKRRLREAVRLHGLLPAAMDVVINPQEVAPDSRI